MGKDRFFIGRIHFAVNSLNNFRFSFAHFLSAAVGFRRIWAIISRIIFRSFTTVGWIGFTRIPKYFSCLEYITDIEMNQAIRQTEN